MKNLIIILSAILIGLFIASCSDLQTDITPPPAVNVHTEGINTVSSPNFHGNLIKAAEWNMKQCQKCHASDYSGGYTFSSCLDCHTHPKGPESCNTCHGSFANPARIAPPRDTKGNIATTAKGVGAHALHLYDNMMGAKVECNECHIVPQNLYDPGHLTPIPGHPKILFGELAKLKTKPGEEPVYDFANNTCSNTYCHGNFVFYRDSSNFPQFYTADVMTGNNRTVSWTKVDGSEAACGTCHGLPPTGHVAATLSQCGDCHRNVVDAQGNILDKSLHINGKVDVFW